jgi:uncharacterized protein
LVMDQSCFVKPICTRKGDCSEMPMTLAVEKIHFCPLREKSVQSAQERTRQLLPRFPVSTYFRHGVALTPVGSTKPQNFPPISKVPQMTRALFALSLLAITHTSSVLGDDARTIAVIGLGEIITEPDIAHVELAVTSTGTELRVAKREVDKVMAALLEVVKQLKIADDDVVATELQVVPEWDSKKQRNTNVFEISRSMTVTLRQLTKLDELLNAAIDAGANRIESIMLKTSKEKELQGQALTLAINDAKEQASKIAAGLDVTIGKVHKVTGNDGPYVSMLSAPIEGLSGETYKPAKIKVEVGIGVVYQLE